MKGWQGFPSNVSAECGTSAGPGRALTFTITVQTVKL